MEDSQYWMMNSWGPSAEPCGTPWLTFLSLNWLKSSGVISAVYMLKCALIPDRLSLLQSQLVLWKNPKLYTMWGSSNFASHGIRGQTSFRSLGKVEVVIHFHVQRKRTKNTEMLKRSDVLRCNLWSSFTLFYQECGRRKNKSWGKRVKESEN